MSASVPLLLPLVRYAQPVRRCRAAPARAVRAKVADRWGVVNEGRLHVDVQALQGVEMGEYLRMDVMWQGNGQRREGLDGLDLPVVILDRVLELWFGR